MNPSPDTYLDMETEIDRALKMSVHPQIPEGLANRVHQNLTIAADSKAAHKGWLVWIPATCATMSAALLLVMLLHHTRSSPVNQAGIVQTVSVSARDSAQTEPVAVKAVLTPIQIASDKKFPPQPANRASRKRDRGRNRHAANLFNYPLTRQEKLLLQFARTAKPADLRDLDPEYQAKLEAQQEAEFAAYLRSGDDSRSSSDSSGTTETALATQTTQE